MNDFWSDPHLEVIFHAGEDVQELQEGGDQRPDCYGTHHFTKLFSNIIIDGGCKHCSEIG